MTPQRRATAIGLSAILLWSSLAVLTMATKGLPPFQVLTIGFGAAAIVGLCWLARSGLAGLAVLRQPASALALTTLALFGYHALYFIALKRAPAIEANLINYLWPLLIVVFAALLPGGRVRRGQVVGSLLGLVAAVLLVTRGQGIAIDVRYVPGYLAALGAAVTWAAYSVLNRRHAGVPSAAIVLPCLLVALLGAASHCIGETWVAPTPLQWVVLGVMGLGPVGAAFLLWDHGTKHGDIALLGSLSYAAPLLSTLLLLAFGAGRLHWTVPVAIALILFGAWLSLRAPDASPVDPPSTRFNADR